MDEGEQLWAREFYAALMQHAVDTDRSFQSSSFRVGVSDLGFCSERLRRMLLRMVPEEKDAMLMWIGTALGDAAEEAIMARFPDMIRQAEVSLRLESNGRVYQIPGHPDLIDPVHGILWDGKTDYGLDVIARTGPSQQQRFQRHGYAKAAYDAGLFPNHKLEDLQVGDFYIDRSGIERRLHVDLEPYDPAVVASAEEWLGEVIYAYTETAAGRPTEAQKEPPREMCYAVCGFASECRGDDTDVEGLLTDPTVLTSVEMYAEGLDLSRQGNKFKDQAKAHLIGINGFTPTHAVRWVWINETEHRKGYYKIDVKERKTTNKKQETSS